ncbi:MAG: DUF4112 domain-containing protein [Gemmataceae bacterium]|nr:DUF4112 domain-containing protein [Gemmataceae bacterium]
MASEPITGPPAAPPVLLTDAIDHKAAVRTLAKYLDNVFVVPGTNFRVGLDTLIGLIPGLGDVLGSAIGGYIILVAAKLGVPKAVIGRMLLNQGIDAAVGIVPFAGDLLDAAWRSNAKNARLLEQALEDPARARRGSTWVLIGLGLVVLLIGAAGAVGTWLLVQYLFAR